jgi:signal transduction histidine kinase
VNLKEKDGILTVLVCGAFLGSCGLWLTAGTAGIPGLLLELLGIASAAVLLRRRKRMQAAERQDYAAALETRELEYQEAMKNQAVSSRRELEAFRSTLSHSLRMPVAIIQGYAELLEGDVITDPEVRREYLGKIVQRSQYMTDVMSRQFSTDGLFNQLTYSEIDLMDLVRQAAADIRTAASEQGVSVQVVSQEDHLMVQVDSYLMNRVLFNLLENAVKYMGRPGSVTIRVVRKGEQVDIQVRDDGMGLPEEETAHIFEANFQGSNHVRGQGYGLYLVKRTVEAHGGAISAQSGLGRGMGITLTLPLRPAAFSAGASQK